MQRSLTSASVRTTPDESLSALKKGFKPLKKGTKNRKVFLVQQYCGICEEKKSSLEHVIMEI